MSFLATHDVDAEVKGLDAVPPADRPNVVVAHVAFQAMVGCGLLLIAAGLLYWLLRARRSERLERSGALWPLLVLSPLGMLALEAGWFVTEVGRQPWVIYGSMRTGAGVTPVAQVPITFVGFTVLYFVLGCALVVLLRRLAGAGSHADVEEATTAEVNVVA